MRDEKILAARFDQAAANLGRIGDLLLPLDWKLKVKAQEIRLRVGRPVMISMPEEDLFVHSGALVSQQQGQDPMIAGRDDMNEAFRRICNSSVYSHQNEIRNGFVILRGGHRAGICGTAVTENGQVANIRDISSINLRIAKQISGAADEIVPVAVSRGGLTGTLIFGPPGCGKTTVLRDLARQLSAGIGIPFRYRVAVVDERGEIAATFTGQPQNDLGPCCDVLDGYPKGEGIMQAVRCLSPDVVICDEIGGEREAEAVEAAINAGVRLIASAHAGSFSELKARPQIARLLASGAFQKAVQLKGRESPGQVEDVFPIQTEPVRAQRKINLAF